MDGFLRRRWLLVALSCLCATGCAAALGPADPQKLASTDTADREVAKPGEKPAPPHSPYLAAPAITAVGNAAQPSSAEKTKPTTDPEALQKILAEVQALGPIDPAVQQQLVADLRQTDPVLWPMMMQTFRAGMAYRQQANKPSSSPPATNAVPASSPEKSTTTAPQPESSAPSVVPSAAMLDAASTSLSPRGAGTPGLAFPATAMLQAALASAQRQATDAAEPAPPTNPATSSIRTASHSEPTATNDRRADDAASPTVTEAKADWQQALADALESLESQTAEPPTNAQEVTRHVWRRVLCLAAGRRDDALKPIPGIAAAEQDFWTEQIFALATYLDSEKLTDPARRSAAAAQHLSKATARLSEASTLAVKNLAFCTEVSSYGVYQKFKSDEFQAGQPLILYAEIENFKSDESSKGFHTALRSSYQILDAQGRRVAENDLALTEEYCQNRRRDYFIRYFLSIPERTYVGKYTLQLTIVDTLSQKIGQSTIDFTVVEK